jgi:hypothetical protein
MNCTEILKARVTSEIKRQAKAIADRELLTEAAWLKRVVMKEIRSIERSGAGAHHDQLLQIRRAAHDSAGRCKPVYVRISDDDRVLLESRAAARAMRPATYVSVLARAHLRALTPLPKDELIALKQVIAELASIGRNINQIAKSAHESGRLPGSAREEFRAMLKVCEALRDKTKGLLKANVASWRTGHAIADV